MDENVDVALRFGALQLALATAAIHLWIGWGNWLQYILAGQPFLDPLQALFVLSSVGVLVGVWLAARGVRLDVVYALGIVLMLGYLLGWVFMGGVRTGGSLYAPAWESVGHSHGSPLVTLVRHLLDDWLLLASKVVEATCLGVLSVLLYGELSRDEESADGDATSGAGS